MFHDALFLSAALLWLFAVGSTVGSFLNVVVYRMPAGLSLLFPSSRCPACKTPIRLRDNVPILGWLLLRGRCRDCGVNISARYPLVELATALIFVVLAWFEPLSNDMNLPWVGLFLRGLPSIGQHNLTTAQIWGIYSFHLLLLCSLLTATLIEYDGHAVPLRLLAVPLIIGLIAPAIWPWLNPNSAGFMDHGIVSRIGAALANNLWGLFVAAALAMLIYRATGCGAAGKATPEFPMVALMWTVVFLNERACLVSAVAAAVISLVAVLSTRYFSGLDRIPWSGWYGLAVLAWLIQWRRMDAMLPQRGGPIYFLIFSAIVVLLYLLSWVECKVRVRNFNRRCGM